jgi:hypothetical protein
MGTHKKFHWMLLMRGEWCDGSTDDELQKKGAVTLRRDGWENTASKATGEARAEESS